ncbi:MAG: ribosomal protein S18-alanine N-acetyltransferase [Bacilli bacterium]
MIRPLQIKDIDIIVQLEEEIFGETLGKEMLENELNNPLVWFRVLEIDNQVIGYIGGYFYLEDGEILNFLIDKSKQHQGYGTILFESILQEARKKGIKKVTLEVRESNSNAISFYTKFGFSKISIRKHYYQNGDNAIVMIKENI